MIRIVADSYETAALDAEDCSTAEDAARRSPVPTRELEATRGLANLDLLRSVAVGLVFIGHMTGMMRIRGLGDIGHFGVLLFFVHTSLVLMLSMERLRLSGIRLYTTFMVRRIFRIYPLSVLTVLLVVAFRVPSAPWMGGFVWPSWPALVSNILLTQNITHSGSVDCVLWSLPFEVQMYAVLPVLYVLIRRFPSPWAVMLIWLAGVAVAAVEQFIRSGTCDSEFLLFRYFPCFLAGVFAWQLLATRARGGFQVGFGCLFSWPWSFFTAWTMCYESTA